MYKPKYDSKPKSGDPVHFCRINTTRPNHAISPCTMRNWKLYHRHGNAIDSFIARHLKDDWPGTFAQTTPGNKINIVIRTYPKNITSVKKAD